MGDTKERILAAALYGPMFLLYAVYDGAEDKGAAAALLDDWLECERRRLKGED